jgi:hypothetical protein
MKIIEDDIDVNGLVEIGRGNHRIVYNIPYNPNEVIKYSYNPYNNSLTGNSNYIEFMVWDKIKSNKKLIKYFCPITGYTKDYSIITMVKASVMKKEIFNKKLINNIPELLRIDTHRIENWGLLDSQPVLIDYGFDKNVNYFKVK